MVAYNFQPRFVPLILDGSKRQTIRRGRKRHARPGEELQLYTAQRSPSCELVGRSYCVAVHKVELIFEGPRTGFQTFASPTNSDPRFATWSTSPASCNEFARVDGFRDWRDLAAWFEGKIWPADRLEGFLIRWEYLL